MEDNFEKKLRESLGNPPEFPFEERLWNDVENKLNIDDTKPTNKLGGIAGLLFLLLAGLMTILAAVFYVKQSEALERLDEIEGKISQVSHEKIVENNNIEVIHDTVYIYLPSEQSPSHLVQEKYVRNRTTSQKYSTKKINNSFQFNNTDFSKLYQRFEKSNQVQLGLRNDFERVQEDSKLPLDIGQLLMYTKNSQREMMSSFESSVLDIAFLKSGLLEAERIFDLRIFEYQDIKSKKNADYYLLKLRPTSFALSTSAGISYSLNLGGRTNFVGGLQAEVGYGRNFSFVIGLEYLSNNFKLEFDDDDIPELADIESPSPDNLGDILHELYGDFSYLQIPFGIKYVIPTKKRIRPYFGLGLITHKSLKSNLAFEYLSNLEEYKLELNNVLDDRFEINDFWTTIGLQYDISRHWNMFVEGSAQIEFKSQPYRYQNHQYIKTNIGLQYIF